MKVLIGVDESPESRDAVQTAFELFGPGTEYTVASIGSRVISNIGPVLSAGYPAHHYANAAELNERFDAAEAAAQELARSATTEIADVRVAAELGHVGVQLCRLAEEQEADFVVIGSQDKKIWQRLFDPSVGRYLIDNAPCPVLVIR